jgi:methyl-accepting chemotaxis protein
MSQLDSMTQRNAAAAEELSTTAEEMNSQAETLQDAIAFFQVDEEQLPEMQSTFIRPEPDRRKRAVVRPVHPAPIVAAAPRRPVGGRAGTFQSPASAADDPEFQRF